MERCGYMGKILWVDLANKTFTEESFDETVYQQYLTGYGLGAIVLFKNKIYNADPLGPDNVLGVMSGLLTNTGAFFSGRWEVVGKSPLTGGWGDANCGGYFAPAIKKTGYDGIFFKGISETPVYLLIDGDSKKLCDAGDLWGKKDTAETEDILIGRHGDNFKVACIGRGAENLCRFGAIITDKGRAAARSGLGAVMGSKKLKAICLGGRETTPIYDVVSISRATGEFMNAICTAGRGWKNKLVSWIAVTPFFSGLMRFFQKHNLQGKIEPPDVELYSMRRWGTCSTTAVSANNGDSPVKNWKGVGYIDFPARKATRISDNAVTAHETTKYGCHHCPLECGGKINFPENMNNYPLSSDDPDVEEVHKIEYETSCGFGTLICCDNLAAIVEINEMLNKASIDTISCAAVVAWAVEAYEKGIITKKDTDGIELKWGDITSVKALVTMIINNEGIGQILKEGLKRASAHFEGGKVLAMEAGGQELPMHDPRQIGGIGLGVQYEVEPTPGRHTSTCDACDMYKNKENSIMAQTGKQKKIHKMKGRMMRLITAVEHNVKQDPVPDPESLADASCMADLVNGLGLCLDAFGLFPTPPPLLEWINGATGWKFTFREYLKTGKRIKVVRHAFNLMAGLNLEQTRLPDRVRGYTMVNGKKVPVLKKGPNAGRMPAIDDGNKNYYEGMGYEYPSGMPSEAVLNELDLGYVKEVLHGLSAGG